MNDLIFLAEICTLKYPFVPIPASPILEAPQVTPIPWQSLVLHMTVTKQTDHQALHGNQVI